MCSIFIVQLSVSIRHNLKLDYHKEMVVRIDKLLIDHQYQMSWIDLFLDELASAVIKISE